MHCAFEVCRVLHLFGCAQLCMFVLVLFRCACYVELRAAEVVGSYFTESWFPAPETQILFSRPPPLCSCVLCSVCQYTLWNCTLLCVSDTLQWWLAPTLLYIGETGRGGDGGGVFRGRANNNWRTQSQPAQNQPLTASHVPNFGKSLGGMISTDEFGRQNFSSYCFFPILSNNLPSGAKDPNNSPCCNMIWLLCHLKSKMKKMEICEIRPNLCSPICRSAETMQGPKRYLGCLDGDQMIRRMRPPA